MLKILTILLFSTGLLLSQTAQFPASIATPQQLGVVANGVTGTLNNSLTTSSTSANITNGTCTLGGQTTTCSVAFQPYMFVTIQNEIAQICSLGSGTGVTILNFGVLGSACPSISGRGLDGTQIAAHTTPSFPNKITVSNNITAWPHMADSAEIQAIETSIFGQRITTPQQFGAKCDGSTDDTAYIQSMWNTIPSYTKVLVSGVCLESSDVYMPLTLVGVSIEGMSKTSGFKAKTGSTPFTLLKIFSHDIVMKNLFFDCNNHTANHGLVFVNGYNSKINSVQSNSCILAPNMVDEAAGPSTTLTGSIAIGSGVGHTVTVANANLPGCSFGSAANFFKTWIDFGTTNQEQFTFTASGNTLTQTSPASSAHTHSFGANIICAGNNNLIHFDNLTSSFSSTDWGFKVNYGTDENGIVCRECSEFNDFLGGELWSGSGNRSYSNHSEANSGPGIQLGDFTTTSTNGNNGRHTVGFLSDPFIDLENSLTAYNAVVSACSDFGTIYYNDPSFFTASGAGVACPLQAGGVTDIGYGSSADSGSTGYRVFSIKTAFGMVKLQAGVSGRILNLLQFYDKDGTLLSTCGLGDTTHQCAWDSPQFFKSSIFVKAPINKVVECTGSGTPDAACTGASTNNAIKVVLRDPSGTLVPLSSFLPIVLSLGHSLQAGVNTIEYNGVSVPGNIHSNLSPNSNLGTAISSGTVIRMFYNSPFQSFWVEGF